MKLTPFQRRVLLVLSQGPVHPELLYSQLWPKGKFAERNFSPSRGGPSRGACAVNWHLGKMRGLVERLGQQNNPWKITPEGRKALKEVGSALANR